MSVSFLHECELTAYREARSQNELELAWYHLERARIVSQSYLGPHLASHWAMLGFAFDQRDWRDVAGQIVGLILAPIGPLTGRIPVGNTGARMLAGSSRCQYRLSRLQTYPARQMIVALRNPKENASGHGMRSRLFTLLIAFAVLWCGAGGSAFACATEGTSSALVSVNAIDQLVSTDRDDAERRSKPAGQAVSHHHCCAATYAIEAPFEVMPALKQTPVELSNSATLTSFAQAPPVQPPAA